MFKHKSDHNDLSGQVLLIEKFAFMKFLIKSIANKFASPE